VNIYQKFIEFWDKDRSLTVLLITLILSVLVVPSLLNFGTGPIDILLTIALLAGIRFVSQNRFQMILLSIFAVLALVIRVISTFSHGNGIYLLRAISNIVSLSILAAIVLIQVFRKGPITLQRVQGAVAEYLLLGLIWASAYELVELFIPRAILNGNLAIPPQVLTPNLIYFSFVTLTTVGYGDFTPVHHIARSLAILEALTGQLFPAILIARLVSMELLASSKRHL
jgi:hypothetical protein